MRDLRLLRRNSAALLPLTVCLMLAGCGVEDPDRRQTAPVTVTVTYEGQPVEGATVTFISEEEPVVTAVGRTDDQGVTQLTTYESEDGAVLGRHQVTITKSVLTEDRAVADQESGEYEPQSPGGSPVPATESPIPRRYASATNSELFAEVTPDGDNEIEFDLTD